MQPDRHLSEFLSHEAPLTASVPQISSDTVHTLLHLTDIPPVFGEANAGRAAINIAANRLLAAGARPRYVAAAVEIDTDTPIGSINIVADGMRSAAIQAEMEWTARSARFAAYGPPRGIALSIYAIGQADTVFSVTPECIRPGDGVIVTSPVGGFGTAVEAAERGITVVADADGESLTDAVDSLTDSVPHIHFMALAEDGLEQTIEKLSDRHDISLDRNAVPVRDAVRAACGIMGLDPLKMRCAASMLVIVCENDIEKALAALRRNRYCSEAALIGKVSDKSS